MAQSIFSNTIIASSGRVINLILGVVITGLLARLLGVSLYGAYSLLLAYGSLLQIAADFGLYLVLTRSFGSANTSSRQELLSHATGLRLVLLVGSFCLGLVVAYLTPSLHLYLLPLVIAFIGLSFQSISQLLMGVFQAEASMWRATVGDILGRLLQLGGLLLGVRYAFGHLLLFAVSLFLVSTAITYVVHWALRPPYARLRPRFSVVAWKQLLVQAWPLALLLFLNVIYFRVDMVILSIFRSAQEVGWYGLAYRVIESGLFFPAMFGGLLLPRLTAYAAAREGGAISRLLSQSLQMVALVVALGLVVIWQEAVPLLNIVAGKEFLSAAPLLRVLMLAFTCMVFGNIFGFSLVAFQRQKVLVILYGSLVVFNVVGNVLFIPFFGALAAAWMTVATEVIASGVAGFFLWQQYPFSIGIWYGLRVVVVAVATALVWSVFPEDWSVFARLFTGVVLYGIASLSVGLWRPHQFQDLLRSPSSTTYA